jgi:hypothetical protein
LLSACKIHRRFAFQDLRDYRLAGQRAFDENGFAVEAGNAATFLVERFDKGNERHQISGINL